MGKIFALPDEGQGGPKSFLRVMKEVKDKIKSTFSLIDVSNRQMKEYLKDVQVMKEADDVSLALFYQQFLKRERTILTHLNMLKSQGTLRHGYCWSPLSQEKFLEQFYGPEVSLIDAHDQRRSARQYNLQIESVPTDKLEPPTYFKLNEFTFAFQQVVNEYAIPTYKEANPGIYIIVTFPFLFGVMYGDMGHGGCILFVATVLCMFSGTLAKIPDLKPLL